MIGAIIQARLGSTRLPSKILRPIAGKPMLQHVVERAHAIKGLDKVIVATPIADLATIQHAIPSDVYWWGGEPDDVLDRYVTTTQKFELDVIMRLTADCPLIDPKVCTLVLETYCTGRWEYVSNVSETTDGLDCEVFSRASLLAAWAKADQPGDREHVTPWMRRNLRCGFVRSGPLPAKWSVDTDEDLERVRAVFQS